MKKAAALIIRVAALFLKGDKRQKPMIGIIGLYSFSLKL